MMPAPKIIDQSKSDTPHGFESVTLSRRTGRMLVNGYQSQARQGSAIGRRVSALLGQALALSVALTMQQETAQCPYPSTAKTVTP